MNAPPPEKKTDYNDWLPEYNETKVRLENQIVY